MANFIIIAVVAAIIAAIGVYLCRAKKKGAGCIGCPCSGSCSSKCACSKENI